MQEGEIQACGQGLWGPQQLKQDGRALFSPQGGPGQGPAKKPAPTVVLHRWGGELGRAESRAQSWGSCPVFQVPSLPISLRGGTGQRWGRGCLCDSGGTPKAGHG